MQIKAGPGIQVTRVGSNYLISAKPRDVGKEYPVVLLSVAADSISVTRGVGFHSDWKAVGTDNEVVVRTGDVQNYPMPVTKDIMLYVVRVGNDMMFIKLYGSTSPTLNMKYYALTNDAWTISDQFRDGVEYSGITLSNVQHDETKQRFLQFSSAGDLVRVGAEETLLIEPMAAGCHWTQHKINVAYQRQLYNISGNKKVTVLSDIAASIPYSYYFDKDAPSAIPSTTWRGDEKQSNSAVVPVGDYLYTTQSAWPSSLLAVNPLRKAAASRIVKTKYENGNLYSSYVTPESPVTMLTMNGTNYYFPTQHQYTIGVVGDDLIYGDIDDIITKFDEYNIKIQRTLQIKKGTANLGNAITSTSYAQPNYWVSGESGINYASDLFYDTDTGNYHLSNNSGMLWLKGGSGSWAAPATSTGLAISGHPAIAAGGNIYTASVSGTKGYYRWNAGTEVWDLLLSTSFVNERGGAAVKNSDEIFFNKQRYKISTNSVTLQYKDASNFEIINTVANIFSDGTGIYFLCNTDSVPLKLRRTSPFTETTTTYAIRLDLTTNKFNLLYK